MWRHVLCRLIYWKSSPWQLLCTVYCVLGFQLSSFVYIELSCSLTQKTYGNSWNYVCICYNLGDNNNNNKTTYSPLVTVTPRIFMLETSDIGWSRQFRHALFPTLVSKYNFASLGSVQLHVVLSCPALHVVNFAASRVSTARWHEDLCVVSILDEPIQSIRWLQITGCDDMSCWADTRALCYTGFD